MSSTIERSELAIVERLISADQLDQALTRERAVTTMKLGTRLLELNLITEEQLQGALQAQAANPARHLGEILLDLGLVSRAHLNQVLCEKLGIPLVDLARFEIDPAVLRTLPEDLVLDARVVPLCQVEGKLVVAVSDPLESAALERVRFFVQRPVTPVMATRDEIEEAIRTYYGAEVAGRDAQATAKPVRPETREAELQIEIAPVDEPEISMDALVDKMIADACAAYAAAIHIDARFGAQNVVIRLRRDGQLSEYLRLPPHSRSALVTRIKTIAGIDIAERRRAQEGRIDFVQPGGANAQLRVMTVPTRHGNEDIAIEVLAVREPLPLHMLGLREPVLDSIRRVVARRSGLIVVAGPAGSGRTTMLHALLTLVDAAAGKIWTVENPVEITHTGLSQIEVNTRIGWDYAAIVRAVSRADPDVVMIGEMRDRETAAAAMEASLKRCLVLGALHGNGAVQAVARLLDMGLDAFGLSDALLAAVGQRLARRLCLNCRKRRAATASEVDALLREYCEGTALDASQVRADWTQRFGEVSIHEAAGCNVCSGTGHHGRIGLHELLLGGPALRHLMLQRRPLDELMTAAVHGGMRTLKQDGLEKAIAGHCDLREVRAATL